MKIPYDYVWVGEGIAIHEERADVVRSILMSAAFTGNSASHHHAE